MRRVNRLAGEPSPYLRQHAENPVDWRPWGDEAFDEATRRDVPVFLSIGYSACHWCHVMAHESFEDEDTARQLNASFIPVKVDREERPDVDAVYMEAVQAVTGSGGWPMSVFLTPDQQPFYGGTYFPAREQAGMPSFRTVLSAVRDIWLNRRDEVEEQAKALSAAIATGSAAAVSSGGPSILAAFEPDIADPVDDQVGRGRRDASTTVLAPAVERLAQAFDADWGGFGSAPKFPQPTLIDVVLRYVLQAQETSDPTNTAASEAAPGTATDDERASVLAMATTTLDAMAAGGIYDHLGGGFARYSTDVRWLVPHFEKMLYDQAGLLRAYLHGWQVTGKADYLGVVEGIVSYVERDLTDPSGGLYSAEDADSEGEEGRFYIWTPDEMAAALSTWEGPADGGAGATAQLPELADVLEFFGVTDAGDLQGRSILHRPVGAPLAGTEAMERARRTLRDARGRRPRPGLDDKVLTEWNAMYASALAEAAQATGDRGWGVRAVAIGRFLVDHLVTAEGRWLRAWQPGGGPRLPAYAGDYAWLVDCFTRLSELTGEALWYEQALSAADGLLELFGDRDGGGFFTTGSDAEALIVRTKDLFDGATPSANGVAARALARLGALSGDRRYVDAARRVLDLIGGALTQQPMAVAYSVLTAEVLLSGVTEVVVVGDRTDLVDVVRRRWLPSAVLAWGEPTASPLWQGRQDGRAYVCRNHACRLPASDPATLVSQLTRATTLPSPPPAPGDPGRLGDGDPS